MTQLVPRLHHLHKVRVGEGTERRRRKIDVRRGKKEQGLCGVPMNSQICDDKFKLIYDIVETSGAWDLLRDHMTVYPVGYNAVDRHGDRITKNVPRDSPVNFRGEALSEAVARVLSD
jgi:hypothetical protein